MPRGLAFNDFGGARHPRAVYWVATAAAIFMVTGFAFAPIARDAVDRPSIVVGSAQGNGAATVLVFAAAAVLIARGRWPRAALGATLVVFVAGTAVGGPVASYLAAILIAVFGVAQRTDRRTTLIAAAVSAVLAPAFGALLLTGHWQTLEASLQLAAFIGFAAAAGDATRSRREFITAITERARRAEETKESEAKARVAEERLRIARDLHDMMAHHIAVINLHASVASGALKDRPDEVEKSLATIRQAARTVLGEIGGLLSVLRSADADGTPGGPGNAPVPGLAQLDDLLADFRRSGLEIDVRTWGTPSPTPEPVDVVAYRVIQEALTNAQKHGADRSALLNIDYSENGIEVIVTNTTSASHSVGAGGSRATPGHGLLGARERVASISGTLDTSRGPGPVYRFTAWLPFPVTPPATADGAGADPAVPRPALTDPALTDPALSDAAVTGAAVTGAAVSDAAVTDPALSDAAVTDAAATGTDAPAAGVTTVGRHASAATSDGKNRP
jgi:signal transduction histidine kinase